MEDIDELFTLLRKYCKEDIIIINYFRSTSLLNNDKIKEYFNYANTKLKNKKVTNTAYIMLRLINY